MGVYINLYIHCVIWYGYKKHNQQESNLNISV